jgi:hypothetical protein
LFGVGLVMRERIFGNSPTSFRGKAPFKLGNM